MFLKPSTSKRVNAGSANSEPSTPAAQRRFTLHGTRPIQRERLVSSNGTTRAAPQTPSQNGLSMSVCTPGNVRDHGAAANSSVERPQRKVRQTGFACNSSVTDLERQIRRLLSERSTILKRADSKDAELNKTVSKLQGSLQAKTYLQSSLARIEREVKDLRKSNDILKTKVSTLETTGLKKKDIQVELANARGTLVARGHDLADAKAQVQELQQKLDKRNKAFKQQEVELQKLTACLSSDIRSLRSDLASSQAQINELGNVSENSYDKDRMEKLELTTSTLLALINEVKDITDSDQVSSKLDELKSEISSVLNEFSKIQSNLIASEDTIARLQSECEDKDMMIEFMTHKLGNMNFSGNGSLAGTDCSAVSQDVLDSAPQRLTQQWVDHQMDGTYVFPDADANSEQGCNPTLNCSHLESTDPQQTEDLEKLRLTEETQSEIVTQLQLKVQSLESECDHFYQLSATTHEELQNAKSDCGKKALMIASLLQKIECYQGECDATTEAAQNLEEYIRNVQKENESLQADIQAVQMDKEGLTAFANELQHQVEDGHILVAEQELSVDLLKQNIDQMLTENTDKHAYIEDLEERVHQLTEKAEQLQAELGQNADAIISAKDQIHCLETECATKTGLVSAIEEELKESCEEVQRVNENALQLSERIRCLEMESDTNAADLLAVKGELQAAVQSYEGTQRHNELLQQNTVKLQNELQQSAARVQKLEEDASILREEVASKSQVLQSTEQELNSSKANLEIQEALAGELHKSLQNLKYAVEVKDETVANLESQVANLQDKHNEQCVTIEEKEKVLLQAMCDFNNQTIIVQELRALADKLTEEAKAKTSNIVILQANIVEIQTEYNQKVSLLEESKMHTESLEAQLKTKDNLISELQGKMDNFCIERDAALEYRQQMQLCLSEYQEQIVAKSALVEDLLVKLNTTTESAKCQSDRLSELTRELGQLKVEHEKRISLVQDCENRLEKLNNEYESAKTVLENVRQHLAGVQNDLNEQLTHLKLELQQKIAEVEELHSNCESLSMERDQLLVSLKHSEETLQNDQVQHTSEIKAMNETLGKLKEEILAKECNVKDLEKQLIDVQEDLTQQLTNQTTELQQTSAKVQELHFSCDSLLAERDGFANALGEKEKQLQEAEVQHIAAVEDMNITIQKLNEENIAKATIIDELKLKMESIQNDLNQQLTNHKAERKQEIQELRLSCDALQTERDDLTVKISEQNQTIDEMLTAHDIAVQNLNVNIENLKEDVLSKACTIQELQKVLSDTRSEMTEQLSSRTAELHQKVVELEHLNIKCEELQTAKDYLGNQLSEKDKIVQEIEAAHAATAKRIETLQEESSTKTCAINKLQLQVADKEKALSAQEECLSKSKEQSASVQRQLAKKEEILVATYSKLRELEDEMLEKHSIMEQTAASNIKLEEALSHKNNEVNHLHSTIAAVTSELENGHHRQEELCTHVDSLKQILDEKDCQLLRQETDLGLLREQLKREASQMAEQLATRDRLVVEKSEQIAELRKKIWDLQLNVEETLQRLQVSEDTNVKYNALLQEYEEMKQKLSEQEDVGQQEQAALKAELAKLVECSQEMHNQSKKLNLDNKELGEYMRHVETDLHRYRAQTEWYENRERDFAHELNILEQRANGSHTELLKWKNLYEDLRLKVEPFQEQLDMFQAEKAALLSQNSEALGEVHKLSQQYAMLLGHQNNKQKIHHVLKLKEENLEVKKENAKLREQAAKLQQKMRRMEDQLDALGRRKRFDPSKAFVHDKENTPGKDVSNSFRP